jgi:hypothetical protein
MGQMDELFENLEKFFKPLKTSADISTKLVTLLQQPITLLVNQEQGLQSFRQVLLIV